MSNKEWALSAQKTCHRYYCGLGVFASMMWVSKQPSNPTSFIYIYIHYYIIYRNKLISSSRPKKYINIFKKTLFSRNETFSTLNFLAFFTLHFIFPFFSLPLFFSKKTTNKNLKSYPTNTPHNQNAAHPDAVVLVDPELVLAGRLFCKFQQL